MNVPVIDLFAGPGGLSHGFHSYSGNPLVRFNICLSIEKDPIAWRTLHLRAFVRQFVTPPKEYFEYIRGDAEINTDTLASKYKVQWETANKEARNLELGKVPFADVSRLIIKALRGAEFWILLGGPPCQAYSLAGRSRMRNSPDFAKDHRHTLYREYLNIVAVHQPPIFVMENVKGILSAKHGTNGGRGTIFQRILSDFSDPARSVSSDKQIAGLLPKRVKRHGYVLYSFVADKTAEKLAPKDFVIHSEDWGIPQRRHRVILLGVRDDIKLKPKSLDQLFSRQTTNVEDIIGNMPKLRSRLSPRKQDSEVNWLRAIETGAKTLIPSVAQAALKRRLASAIRHLSGGNTGSPYVACLAPAPKFAELWDMKLGGVIQHTARGHMSSDLVRYFFSACFAKEYNSSPQLNDFPSSLLPNHRNAKKNGKKKHDFADRFRVQLNDKPATTITSHIGKDGHYYIHYDPSQCRSLSVREAALIQTFPHSYFFAGTQTQQYQQVGNAVPPLLAAKLAAVVGELLSRIVCKPSRSESSFSREASSG